MKNRAGRSRVAALMVAAGWAGTASACCPDFAAIYAGEVAVGFVAGTTDARAREIAISVGASVYQWIGDFGQGPAYLIDVPPGEERDYVARFEAHMEVRYAETQSPFCAPGTPACTCCPPKFLCSSLPPCPGAVVYESSAPRAIVHPRNAVDNAPASPFDWTPPERSLLFYVVDDGAGLPDTIWLTKAQANVRISF